MSVNDLGKTFLVEDCQRVSISDILREYKVNLKESVLRSQFEMINANVRLTTSQTGNKGIRFWFVCPHCEKRVGVLLKHPLQELFGCRRCLNLEYRKRRFKGMLESEFA